MKQKIFSMSDRWRRLECEIFKNNFILTWNHGLSQTVYEERWMAVQTVGLEK